MSYLVVISILSQTLRLPELGTREEAFQDVFYGHSCSFIVTIYQKGKEQFFFIKAINFPPYGGLDSATCLVSLEVPAGVQDRQQTGGKSLDLHSGAAATR